MKTKRGLSKQRAFLAGYKATASITKGAEAAKIDRSLHYRWLKDDVDYQVMFAAVQVETADVLEDEAVRRAHEGVLEPVFYKGKPVGVIRVYSDTLMQTLLRGFKREKYREHGAVELTGAGGGPIVLEDERLKKLSDEELASLIGLAQKLETA